MRQNEHLGFGSFGAESAVGGQPWATPRASRPAIIFRPEWAEGPCALSRRTISGETPYAGRCLGLITFGAFNADGLQSGRRVFL